MNRLIGRERPLRQRGEERLLGKIEWRGLESRSLRLRGIMIETYRKRLRLVKLSLHQERRCLIRDYSTRVLV